MAESKILTALLVDDAIKTVLNEVNDEDSAKAALETIRMRIADEMVQVVSKLNPRKIDTKLTGSVLVDEDGFW